MIPPPGNWEQLSNWLDTIRHALPHRGVDFPKQLSGQFGSCYEAVQSFREAEKPYVEEIERAVELLSIGEEEGFRVLRPLAAGFLRERLAQANEWTTGMSTKSGSPIDFPDMPFERFARWLLIEWWNEHGLELCVEWHLFQQDRC